MARTIASLEAVPGRRVWRWTYDARVPSPRFRPFRFRRWLVPFGAIGVAITPFIFGSCTERLFYVPTREATPAPLWWSADAKAIRFASADGTALVGWFVPAIGTPPEKAATIVHVHGNAGSMNSHQAFVEHWPGAGVNVFLFDYRGYGESAGRARQRDELIADTLAALATARTLPNVDPARIVLSGQSLRGAVAIIACAQDAARGGSVRGLLLEAPFASWRDVAADHVGRLLASSVGDAPRPLDTIAELRLPILILHGEADAIVPVDHGKRLAAAAPNATLVTFPGGEHNTLQESHPEVRRRMVEFARAVSGP